MHRLHLAYAAAVLLSGSMAASAQQQLSGYVKVIDNRGGGTIAYAQMPAQHTLQGAIGKVLQYVHEHFGARP